MDYSQQPCDPNAPTYFHQPSQSFPQPPYQQQPQQQSLYQPGAYPPQYTHQPSLSACPQPNYQPYPQQPYSPYYQQQAQVPQLQPQLSQSQQYPSPYLQQQSQAQVPQLQPQLSQSQYQPPYPQQQSQAQVPQLQPQLSQSQYQPPYLQRQSYQQPASPAYSQSASPTYPQAYPQPYPQVYPQAAPAVVFHTAQPSCPPPCDSSSPHQGFCITQRPVGHCDASECQPGLDMEALHEKIANMQLDTSDLKIEDVTERLHTRRFATRKQQLECVTAAPVTNYVGDWVGKISNSWKDAITDSVVAVKDPYSNFDWTQFPKCKFGHVMRDKNFYFDPNTLFFSASTIAAVCRPVVESRYKWDEFIHADTTVFRVTQLDNELVRLRHKLSSRFGAPMVQHLMLVASPESGIMSVWNSQIWEPGDVLVLLDCDDLWTRNAADYLADRYDVSVMVLGGTLLNGDQGIINVLTDFLKTRKARLVHVPHIAPESGFVLPVARLVDVCHTFRVPVCVNGELACGQFKLNLTEINADYYVGAHHHWLHSFPVSFVYSSNTKLSPVGNSYFYGETVQTQFAYTGLLDFTSWITANIAQGFLKRTCGGLSAQYKYTQPLAKIAAKVLVEALGTDTFCEEKNYVLMPCVRLPNTAGASQADCVKLMQMLTVNHNVTIHISRLNKGGRTHLYALVCVQIYHERADFVRLAECLQLVLCDFTPSASSTAVSFSSSTSAMLLVDVEKPPPSPPDRALRRANQSRPSLKPGVFGDFYTMQNSLPLLPQLDAIVLPVPEINFNAYSNNNGILPIPLGDAMKKLFYMPTSKVFMNCGSFGCAPRPVVEARHALDIMMQRAPGVFQQHYLNQLVSEATRMLAKEVGSEPDQLVLVDNCNTATSIVMHGQLWEPGDMLFVYDCDYECTLLGARRLFDEKGVVTVEVEIELPCSDEQILAATESRLEVLKEQGIRPRLANFCHITSRTAYIFPAKALVDLFHRYDVPVAIDGAHAPGQLALNLRDIGADYYMGTMHKWMYTLQGVAFLYIHDQSKAINPLLPGRFPQFATTQTFIRRNSMSGPSSSPTTASSVTASSSSSSVWYAFPRDFGANSIPRTDLTQWISAIYSMKFVEECCGGFEKIRNHTHRIARLAQDYLCREFKTDLFQQSESQYANMPLIRLPTTQGAGAATAKLLMSRLLQNNITAFVIRLKKDQAYHLYVRLSVNIYHDMDDFVRLATSLKMLSAQGDMLGLYRATGVGLNFAGNAAASLAQSALKGTARLAGQLFGGVTRTLSVADTNQRRISVESSKDPQKKLSAAAEASQRRFSSAMRSSSDNLSSSNVVTNVQVQPKPNSALEVTSTAITTTILPSNPPAALQVTSTATATIHPDKPPSEVQVSSTAITTELLPAPNDSFAVASVAPNSLSQPMVLPQAGQSTYMLNR